MAKDSPIQFKGTTLKIIQTQLRTTDHATLHQALTEMTGNSPDFFENELAVLDFSNAQSAAESADWPASSICSASPACTPSPRCGLAGRTGGLGLCGRVAGGRCRCARSPARAKLTSRPRRRRCRTRAARTAARRRPAGPGTAARTIILDKPLRSGQRFYAQGCDLIVTAMVSAGAEVIADGHIHVYAPLRGRALAGASGDKRRASSPPAWRPNWCPWPASTGPLKPACRPNCCASRPPSA
jgi:septum site-determining protein MinC